MVQNRTHSITKLCGQILSRNIESRSHRVTATVLQENIQNLVEITKRHKNNKNNKRKSLQGRHLGSINCGDMSTNDD